MLCFDFKRGGRTTTATTGHDGVVWRLVVQNSRGSTRREERAGAVRRPSAFHTPAIPTVKELTDSVRLNSNKPSKHRKTLNCTRTRNQVWMHIPSH